MDGESTERGERSAGESDEEPGPTMQGHMVPSRAQRGRAEPRGRSVDPLSSDVPVAPQMRVRPSWFAAGAIALLVAGVAFGAGRFLAQSGSSDARAKEQLLEQGRVAIENHAWESPAKLNIREITDDALSRFPDDKRFRAMRQDAAAHVLADAIGRKYDGALADALRLARLANELDPSLVTAQKLADDLASAVEDVTPGAPPVAIDDRPATKAASSSRVPHPVHPADARPSASVATAPATPSAKPAAGASAAVLPPTPPPLPDDMPTPPASARPWL
jgi:hypothetical protein